MLNDVTLTKVKVIYNNWSTKPEGLRVDQMSSSFYEVIDLAADSEDKCHMALEVMNDMKKNLTSKVDISGRSFCKNNLIDDNTEGKVLHHVSNKNSKIHTPLAVKSKVRPTFKRKQSKVEQVIRKKKKKKAEEEGEGKN